MIRLFLTFLLIASFAYGQGQDTEPSVAWVQPLVPFGPFCNSITADSTTYAHNGITLTGISDTDQVAIFVGTMGEDAATNFNVSSMTVDGVSFLEIGDEAGSGVVNTAFYRGNSGFIANAASVDVSVTYSEATTSSVVCVWAITLSEQMQAGSGVTVDDDTASGALVLTINIERQATHFVMGVSCSAAAADTTTWAVLTEQVDTNNGEMSYSAAHLVLTSNTSVHSITSDYAGADDASGAAFIGR